MTTSHPAAGRPRRTLRWLERTLWLVGLLCLGWVAWAWGGAAWYQHRAESELVALERADTSAAESPIPADARPAAPIVPAQPGAPLGRLVVPGVGLRAVVAWGVDEDTLQRAVGWLPGTAPPGSGVGNVALAGHRDTFFRDLQHVEPGDRIDLETPGHDVSYRVEWIRVVEPERMDVVAPTEEGALTLVTCYPFHWIGPAPQRFVVRARVVSPGFAGLSVDDRGP